MREREREKLQVWSADESVPDVPEALEWYESKRLHRGRPADSEVQSQVNRDGRNQQKDRAQQQVKRKPHSADRRARKGKTEFRIQHNSKAFVAPAYNAREKVRSTREGKKRVTVTVEETRRERDTRIEDTPAVPNEPTDHAVTRGRDVSLRCEGGHSPENHTVVLEWYWKPPTDCSGNELLRPVQSAEHVAVNCTTEESEHLPRDNDHEGRNAE